jgi:tetratricopeptide (TPR) repeat protein
MAEILIQDVTQPIRDMYNRGFAALERGNLDYAIELFSSCLEAAPELLQARKCLRAATVKKKKAAKSGFLTPVIAGIKGFPISLKLTLLGMAKKHEKAVIAAEKLLQIDPLHTGFVLAFANAAEAADLPEAAILTMDIIREHYPDNVKLLRHLADTYLEAGNTERARDCFEKLNQLRPNDLELVKAYKDAMAVHSMARDGWQQSSEGDGSFRDILQDSDEAAMLEKEGKAVKTDKDVDRLIAETQAKLEAEPENINYYRSLGRFYVQKLMYGDAIDIIEQALQRNPGDPELDRQLSAVHVSRFDRRVAELEDAGDEAGAEQVGVEKHAFLVGDLTQRVERYPNDLRLRYEYGVALYRNGDINEAIQQFQSSQKSPKDRTNSLYHLGLCFRDKEQYDMAIQQLELASSEIVTMDRTKKDILYELGCLSELMDNAGQALTYFKEVYQVDIGFRDVAHKVEEQYRN